MRQVWSFILDHIRAVERWLPGKMAFLLPFRHPSSTYLVCCQLLAGAG